MNNTKKVKKKKLKTKLKVDIIVDLKGEHLREGEGRKKFSLVARRN